MAVADTPDDKPGTPGDKPDTPDDKPGTLCDKLCALCVISCAALGDKGDKPVADKRCEVVRNNNDRSE